MLFLNQAAIASVKPDEAVTPRPVQRGAQPGGSIAPLLATLQERREEFHRWTIHEALPANSPTVQDWASQVASFGGARTALPPRCA
jgi:DHA2 family multidrug resistance protein